jgi:hypothetical protein
MDRLRLNETDAESEGVNESSSGLMREVGAFLGRYGLATFFACVLLYSVLVDDREARKVLAEQMRDMSGQMLRLSSGFVQLAGEVAQIKAEGKENTRIQLAQCVNDAETSEKRDRCLGLR